MNRVYKYILPLEDEVSMGLPRGSRILSVGTQPAFQHGICVWVLLDPDVKEKVVHYFRIAGTGHPVDPEWTRFIGTVIMANGELVFHVFTKDIYDVRELECKR